MLRSPYSCANEVNSAVFQAGGLIVVLVEVARKAYLASLVPVIVNAILNEHQIVADIVAFVNKGDFPRSRLGEKQRGKILASWVTSKMRTMAQFGIRDADGGLSDLTEVVEPRHSATSSLRNSSVLANSPRNIEPAPKIVEQRELEQQHEAGSLPSPIKTGEPAAQPYNNSILDSTTLGGDSTYRSDDTPTEPKSNHFESPTTPRIALTDENINFPTTSTQVQNYPSTYMDNYKAPDFPPPVGPKPSSMASQLPALPAIDSRGGDLWTLPSQRHYGDFKSQHPVADEADDWPQEALMHMNFTHR
jgi:hypothetical protein